ncbi:macrophage mannose receptor 1-like [Tachysurus fulvidraco]|uniref:macrophage mannose receptor 1-like n=1 Tax=Tachysurus fulvidraco TaxID=1234273 RepID=UPI001FEE31D6|nr:macrophage mannose receptor 1-like [Tachysurus fulvidraco]
MKTVHVVLLLVALTKGSTLNLVRKNVFVSLNMTWSDAQDYCRKHYEDLSTINTPWDLLKFGRDVRDYLSVEGWVGLSKGSVDPIYTVWSDGSILGLPLFKFGYPSNLISLHCVGVYNMELIDCNCRRLMPFFCYIWAPPMVLVEMMLIWEEALQYCRTFYTDLISVTTDEDLKSSKSISMSSNTSSVWTGLRFMDGSWFWVNQDPLGNMTSLPSCPVNPYRCGALKAGQDVWENRDCNEKMNFLCIY